MKFEKKRSRDFEGVSGLILDAIRNASKEYPCLSENDLVAVVGAMAGYSIAALPLEKQQMAREILLTNFELALADVNETNVAKVLQ